MRQAAAVASGNAKNAKIINTMNTMLSFSNRVMGFSKVESQIVAMPAAGAARAGIGIGIATGPAVRLQCQPNQRAGTGRHTKPGYSRTGSRPGHAVPDAGAVCVLEERGSL